MGSYRFQLWHHYFTESLFFVRFSIVTDSPSVSISRIYHHHCTADLGFDPSPGIVLSQSLANHVQNVVNYIMEVNFRNVIAKQLRA